MKVGGRPWSCVIGDDGASTGVASSNQCRTGKEGGDSTAGEYVRPCAFGGGDTVVAGSRSSKPLFMCLKIKIRNEKNNMVVSEIY